MISVVLVMAGKGSRMNLDQNKVFLPLGNKKVFEYSLNLFLDNNFEVICVVREEERKYLVDYLDKIKVVTGGSTRQESVYNGLTAASGEYVLIHDAARPFVSQSIIDRCVEELENQNSVLVVNSSRDSIYLREPISSINRQSICLAQTPQGGLKEVLLKSHECARKDEFVGTDDISLVLKYTNSKVAIIEGSDENFKITTQLDYITAKEMIKYA